MDKQPKTLGDAIRLGATLKKQAFRLFYDRQNNATCALGAAADASNLLDTDLRPEFFPKHFGLETQVEPLENHTGIGIVTLWSRIIYLNDALRWSREKIADYVDEVLDQKKESFVKS